MKPILEVRNISKKYTIGKKQKRYLSLRDQLVDSVKSIFPKNNNNEHTDTEFYALKDISFDVYPGDTIGIIGRNGAGKSTLLKILSKITPPTSGYIKARGRVASLLEVGTGFHPELTGRENIFLNGAILGMRRWEINQKFDEIVEFSGVEQFLDTPLKHYSSGMQLRLAFAVAAHLDPEILLIDEVLAVGDAEFQKKCLGKMDEVSKSGRTVLFVSHNLGAIRTLCKSCLLINNGQVNSNGKVKEAIDLYINKSRSFLPPLRKRKIRSGNGKLRIVDFYFIDPEENKEINANHLVSGQKVSICALYEFQEQIPQKVKINFGISIYNSMNQFITVLNNEMANQQLIITKKIGKIICQIDQFPFMYGQFNLSFSLIVNDILSDRVLDAFQFFVEEGDFFNSGIPNCFKRSGVYIEQKWKIK